MREIAAAAGVHEFALPAFLAQIDRSVARGLPLRLAPDLVDRMLEYVECRARGAVAGNSQDIMRLDGAVRHDGAKLDRLVAHALRRRVVAERSPDQVADDAHIDGRLAAVLLKPQVEQTLVEMCNRWRLLIRRRVGDHDIEVG